MEKGITVTLQDIAHGGSAVGRYEGKVLFVPQGIPGETVRVAIVQDKGRYAQARLLDVLEPSPARISPPCPHFGACGGCHWQHIAYSSQLEYKQAIVRTQLQRIAGLDQAIVHPTIGMADPWHYRNHAQFAVDDCGRLGFMAAASHKVVPIESCLLLEPPLQELFDALDIDLPELERLSMRLGVRTGDLMMILETADDLAPEIEVDLDVSGVFMFSDRTPVTLFGNSFILEQIAGRTFRISAPSFFQVNTSQAEVLVKLVGQLLAPGPDDVLVDAYCGVGTLSLGLAGKCRHLLGIESSAAAIADALANAGSSGNVTFIHQPVDVGLASLDVQPTLVVMDPPRSGADNDSLAHLSRLQPHRILYVSCDPATLARDIQMLSTHGYRVEHVQPIDMFPQTFHVETVVLITRVEE